jgi:hypothetical protein
MKLFGCLVGNVVEVGNTVGKILELKKKGLRFSLFIRAKGFSGKRKTHVIKLEPCTDHPSAWNIDIAG